MPRQPSRPAVFRFKTIALIIALALAGYIIALPSSVPVATQTPTETFTPTPTVVPTCAAAAFSNGASITIGDNMAGSPYPSNIAVAGLPGEVASVWVDVTGVSHTWPDDIDILLVGPDGQNTLLMSDAGGRADITNRTFTFDDAAAAALPDETQLVSGNFGPTNYDLTTDVFPAPAPAPGGPVAMGVFIGTNPNGTWSLYVRDDVASDSGIISGGWTLHITTTEGTGCLTPTPTNTSTMTATATSTGTATATATRTATARITDTPGGFASYQFSSSAYFDDESKVTPITIYRGGNTSLVTDVTFATANGTATGGAACTTGVDYIVGTQSVHFDRFETQKTVNLTICGDNVAEPDESVGLSLTDYLGTQWFSGLTINDTASYFRNPANIAINGGTAGAPYPSIITVDGAPQTVGSVRVTLYDYACSSPATTDFLLIGPQGQNIVLLADAGGNTASAPVTLNFTDTAGAVVSDTGPLVTGDFEPTSYSPVSNFPSPAPSGSYNEPGGRVGGTGTQTLAGVFGGTNVNGIWSLYVRNRTSETNAPEAVIGNVASGWGIDFPGATLATRTSTSTPTNTPTPVAGPFTRTVTKTQDTNDGLCDTDCSLREAITGAGNGNTIAFSPLFNSPQTITLTLGQINILAVQGNLTINGTGQDLLTISGNNASRIFLINGAAVNLSGMTLRDGYVQTQNGAGAVGGALYFFAGSSVSASNVTFKNNRTSSPDGSGGSVMYGSGNITLSHVVVTGNTSDGAAISTYGNINISDSTVNQNAGGGLDAAGTITAERCVVSNNTGAWWSYAVGAYNIDLIDSQVTGNTGHGIDGGNGPDTHVNIENSVISGNSYIGVYVFATTVIRNSQIKDQPWGSGIEQAGPMYIIDSAITGNTGAQGGGIHSSGPDWETQLYITNSTISGNTAGPSTYSGRGGGIYLGEDSSSGAGRLVMVNSTVANNRSTGYGGGIRLNPGGTSSISNSIISGNTSSNTADQDLSGNFTSLGSNLIRNTVGSTGWLPTDIKNVDPLLMPLADNGGNTLTHALQGCSRARNAGNNSLALNPQTQLPLQGDQRGFPRFVGTSVDIGAYETDDTLVCSTSTATSTPTPTPGSNCGEDFDGVPIPQLPSGWMSSATGTEVPWFSSSISPDSGTNAVFAPETEDIGISELVSPAFSIPTSGASFTYRNLYNLLATDVGHDGMVLEISIDGGAYVDILAAGGSFSAGGYNYTITSKQLSPIAGRRAWSGLSAGTVDAPAYITTTVNMPVSARGRQIRLKWRMVSDAWSASASGVTGVRIDSITESPCLGVTPTPTNTSTFTPTLTPTFTPTVIPSPFPEYDLTISQTAAPNPVGSDNPLTYTLVVSNVPTGLGGGACPNVRFGYPTGTTFTFDSASGTNGYNAVPDAGGVTFTGGCVSSQNGTTGTATLQIVIRPFAPPSNPRILTSLGSNVIVDPENTWNESNEANNTAETIQNTVLWKVATATATATFTPTVLPSPVPEFDLTISQSAPPFSFLGVDYTLTVTNSPTGNGGSACPTVRFGYPTGSLVTYIGSSGTNGFVGTADGANVTFTGGCLSSQNGQRSSAILRVWFSEPGSGATLTSLGTNVVVDPENAIQETDESNNNAKTVMTLIFFDTTTPTQTSTPTASPTPPTPTSTATPIPSGNCDESFDFTNAPALPFNWTSTATGAEVPWTTSTISPDFGRNDAFAPAPNRVGNTELVFSSQDVYVLPGVPLSFKNNYDLESEYDGMVLEVSVNGGPFQDIITAGGSFITGGYNGTISTSFMSPIAGRAAWTGNSGGYITTTVRLPPSTFTYQLKWRVATDSAVAGNGVRIDSVRGLQCGDATPTATSTATPTRTPTATLTPTFTPTPTATPTTQVASISGRVTTASGNGIRNAKVVITGNALIEPIVATTGSFGYFSFDGLRTGETYVVTVNSRHYTFSIPSRIISLSGNVTDADFIADPQE